MSPPPVRCRGPWKVYKRSSETDRWLDELGLYRKHTARDSSCLFRVVSENVYNTQRYFHKVRTDCVEFMASNRHLFEGSMSCPFENYLKEMSNPSEWGGLFEISAMSHLYRRDFVILEANKGPQTKICNGYGKPIFLFYSPDTKHFDAVYTKEHIAASAFCQSLTYQILYDGVYQLKDLSYAIDKMLHDKVPANHIEYFMSENVERRKKQKERAKIFIETSHDDYQNGNNAVALKCKHRVQDSERTSLLKESLSIFVFNRSLIQLDNVCMNCLDVNSAKDLLDNGITPFPYKVAKALDPDIYRNIEFDVWSELRRELRYGARYSDGTKLQVGVKCLCKLDDGQMVAYHCHIQEMRGEGGPCLVFIEELGEKRLVEYEQLEPLPVDQIRPWAPPYRYSRAHSHILSLSQMLQQLGSITRKQGLGKQQNKCKVADNAKSPENHQKKNGKLSWKGEAEMAYEDVTMPTYQHLDFFNFEPMPVEVDALPLMVDCRAGGAHEAAAPHAHAPPLPQPATNGAPQPQPDPHHTQGGGSGDMGGHGITSPASARASTPATTNTLTSYSGGMNAGGGGGMNSGGYMGMGVGGCAPYVCGVGMGVKPLVWCGGAAPPHMPPPPPPSVNPHVYKSVQANGADLPMNDIPTLRYYFNLGVECMWAAYGPPPHPPPPPRHYSPRDLAQDMQQMQLQERGGPAEGHKRPPPAGDKPPQQHGQKGGAQRPLLPPRFKRGNNQDGNQNNHNQNKSHNNMGNKGPNNRRNSHPESRGGGGGGPANPSAGGPALPYGPPPDQECALEPPLITLPYIPYPPPIYPISYYPLESDPAMMGMMGGMGYVGYEEGVEYGAPVPYYAPPFPPQPQPQPHQPQPQPHQPQHHHHIDHK